MAGQTYYSPIALAAAQALAAEGAADFPLYLPAPSDHRPVLYREAGVGLSPPDFERLRSSGVPFLYVLSTDMHRCETVLETKLSSLVCSSEVPPDEKARLVHQVGTSVARDLARDPGSSENLGRASYVVDNIIGSVLSDPLVAGHMLQMAGHERSTASHMFVVSALAVTLGAEIFGSDLEILRALALAGMTHDMGKLGISPEVLNKATPLTPEESQLIEQHPIESVRLLGDDPHVTPTVRQMILQHHEWVDGRGYPLGVSGDELLPGSRIVSVVDSFHAMLGRRSYRRAFTPLQASRALNSQAGRQFDADVLTRWNELFDRCWSQQPVVLPIQPGGEIDEVSSRHEHGQPAPQRKAFGARPKRFTCNARAMVKCVYAGRLHDATCAPDVFVASVHDVSYRGLCMYSAYPMYRGEVVHVQIDKGTHKMWVRGTVAWCRQHEGNIYKAGLRLVQRIPEHEVRAPVDVQGIVRPGANRAEATPEIAKDSHAPPQTAERDRTETPSENELETLAVMAAMRSPTIEAERTVVKLGASSDPEVRRKAIDVLANIGTKAARAALLDLLQDHNPTVREHAVATAGMTKMLEAAHTLRQQLDDPVEAVALRAAGALGRLGERTGLPLVMEALQRKDGQARLAAQVFGEIVGHRFPANERGVDAAQRYLAAKGAAALLTP
ncbi:MAG: HEAT repeat domain-containing protein [Phycisphaerales bacterium]|nr:MAG: HEAT repeat domain-containing protein [Phycisphaerales bacterium]